MNIKNQNEQAVASGILPQYNFRDRHIQIFEENYDLHCNWFKDSSDGWKKKKNVFIESIFAIGNSNDRASVGFRFIDDEPAELIFDLNTWSFDAFNEGDDE